MRFSSILFCLLMILVSCEQNTSLPDSPKDEPVQKEEPLVTPAIGITSDYVYGEDLIYSGDTRVINVKTTSKTSLLDIIIYDFNGETLRGDFEESATYPDTKTFHWIQVVQTSDTEYEVTVGPYDGVAVVNLSFAPLTLLPVLYGCDDHDGEIIPL
mgnify:FL=1